MLLHCRFSFLLFFLMRPPPTSTLFPYTTLFRSRETRELVRIQQAELVESLHKAQSDYGLSTGLAVISEIAELVLPEHEVSEAMFRLILLAAREIERTGNWRLPLSYFAFWTVRLGGWLPRFDRCASCRAAFEASAAFFDPHQRGLFYATCR